MREEVRTAFFDFSVQFEGYVPHMYADIKNLITCGVGNLIDPVSLALAVPFESSPGVRATSVEIEKEWSSIKRDPQSARLGHRYSARRTRLRLPREAVAAMVDRKLMENDALLLVRFPGQDTWPSDAILALHSMAWALGPGFARVFTKFSRLMIAQDFAGAAEECKISERGNPGVIPRNAANRLLLSNAHAVKAGGLPLEPLRWPNVVGQQLTLPTM